MPLPCPVVSRMASLYRSFALLVVVSGIPVAARAQLAVVGGTVHERTTAPGSRYQGSIRVTNASAVPVEARAYQTDLRTSADGATLFAAPGSEPRSNAAWITLSPARVVVPAHGEVIIAYEVRVPNDAAARLAGSWWSTIMIEGAAPATEPAARRPGVAVQVNIRHAVQVATTIPGAPPARAELRSPQLVMQNGRPMLQIDVMNAGTVAFRPGMSLELFDGRGTVRDTQQVRRGLLYPGSSLRQVFALDELPAGDYRALVIADTGGEEMYGAQFRFRR